MAAVATCFSLASATADAPRPSSSFNCSDAGSHIKLCKPYLENGGHALEPSKYCCGVVSGIHHFVPECLCEVLKASVLGAPVNATRASRLPAFCHLPPTHCSAAENLRSLTSKLSPEPSTSPPPSPAPVTPTPATPPARSPPRTPPKPPVTPPPAASPSTPPSAPIATPPNPPPTPVATPPPTTPVATPPSPIATPPPNPPPTPTPTPSPPALPTAPASPPGPHFQPSATPPAAPPVSSGALKLPASLLVLLANLAFATVVYCM
ncbi:unnamed protein product [Musa hybrid cultivar]